MYKKMLALICMRVWTVRAWYLNEDKDKYYTAVLAICDNRYTARVATRMSYFPEPMHSQWWMTRQPEFLGKALWRCYFPTKVRRWVSPDGVVIENGKAAVRVD